jgi:hypothetical protein
MYLWISVPDGSFCWQRSPVTGDSEGHGHRKQICFLQIFLSTISLFNISSLGLIIVVILSQKVCTQFQQVLEVTLVDMVSLKW